MEKNKNKCRCKITLLLGFIFSIIFSISAASALDNTYYWTPSSGAIGSSGYTADWGSCGQSPTTYRITTLSSTGFICNSDYLTTTSSGDQFLAIYPINYSSNTTITGKTGATFYLSGEGHTATYRFDLGYAKNGTFTSLGYVTRSASSNGNLYTIDMSSITGTAPSDSYLALKVSVTSSRGGRIYLGTNGGVTESNSGRFYVSENPLIPPTPSYNVTVTATPTSANTTDGNGYTYNITVNNIGNTQGNYTLNLVDSDTVNFQNSILGTTSMQINSGGSTNTTLTVSAKTNGTIGAIDTTTVTVNSVENPMYTNSTQVSTTIVDTPPPPPTDYKIIVSTDRYSVSSPWNDKPSNTSLSENFTAYALLLDNNGKPVSGQGITFKIYSGDGTVKATETSITQANGLASSVPYDAHNDFTGSADADYGTWKIEAYMTNSPTIISSANMELQAGGNTLGGGCKANCHSTNVGTGGKPQSPYTDGYGQTISRAVAAHKKINHQSQGCYKCHPGYSGIKTGTYGNTSDVHKNMTCDNCHGTWDSFGSSSGTGIPRMPSCYDCHPVSNNNVSIINTLANLSAGNGISVYSYNFDLEKPLAAHNGTMYSLVDSVPCIACHGPAHNISKPYVTSKNNITENEQCWTCHTNRATTHKSNTNCVGCHTQNAHNISISEGGPLPPVTYIPADPTNLQNTTGSFWVNNTWLPGIGNTTDSYNVSVNGTWYNGTINTFENTTTVPHGWVNITVWAYNSSGTGALSAGSVSQNTQVPNNPPVQAPIGNKSVNEGQLLTFTVSATDIDNDIITYGTNATKGTLNTTTGQFSWTPGYGDAGVYIWYFNSSDNYGRVASETVTVTVNNVPLSVTSSSPSSDPTTIQGTAQSFSVTMNRTSSVTWYMNGIQVQTNASVTSAVYTNSTAGIGTWNVTASATDGIDTASRTWNWVIIAQSTYNLSGYVFDNNGTGLGGVQVQNGSKQGTTIPSGYYLITGLFNGTYNFSYTKAGFNTGYLEVIINGADNTSANKTIYDTAPPAQVTGLTNGTPTQTTVNLTWNTIADANYYQVFRDSASLGYTRNNYWNDTGLTADTLYGYTVRANDSYNNWGQNSSILSVRTAQAPDTNPPASVSAPATATGNFYINNTWVNPTDADYSHVWFKYSNDSTLQNVSKPAGYLNLTWSPHYTQNISAQTVDTSGNVNQAKVWFNVTIPNNAPAQSTIGNKAVDEGKLLSFTVSANDADSDSITYGTNATKGSLNATIGQFSWTPGYGDAGIYTWYFNSSDGYGGLANETITVTVNNIPLSITSSAPSSDPITTQGTAQTFNITLNRTANVTWYMNGTQVQTNTGTTSASYTNSTAAAGTWNVTASATDNIDTISRTWNWTVNPQPPANYIPPNPINLQNSSGNFWVNHTWLVGAGNVTNSYNASVNGTWYNGTINTFKNTTTVPHGWVNITVWAYNSSGTGTLSAGSISQNTQVPNNPPVQVPIGNKPVNEGQLLTFTVSATDIDNDIITYGTNATKGTLNTTTGQFSWTPGYEDAGVYVWYFNSSDNYGGVASETITVTVNNVLLSVTNSLPASDPTTTVGTVQAFSITLNRTANITWYIDGSIIQINSSSASANYTNSTAGVGVYNVTAAATDGYDAVSKQWNWTVTPQPVYAPGIISWSNSKTNNDSLTLAVNTSEPVNFNATANQTITTWNWYQDGVNQVNNYDNFTASWNTTGTKTVRVNATNSNGTSNTITWTILTAVSADVGPNCLDCHRSVE